MPAAMRVVVSTLLVLAGLTASAGAQERKPDVTGWWMSLDGTFPALWSRGDIVAMEELLIIDHDGRYENRLMGFWSPTVQSCVQHKECTDAPLVATGRLVLADGALKFLDRQAHAFDRPERERLVRSRTLTGKSAWHVELHIDAKDGVMRLRQTIGEDPRVFVKVEPTRLRRIRAGLLAAGESASQHWRCYLGAATGNAQLLPWRNAAALPQADYLAVASYYNTAISHALRPTIDDPDPAQRKLTEVTLDELMVEPFDSLPPPRTLAERKAAQAAAKVLGRVAKGESLEAARAAVAHDFPGMPLGLDFSEREIAAFARTVREVPKQLFCKDPWEQ